MFLGRCLILVGLVGNILVASESAQVLAPVLRDGAALQDEASRLSGRPWIGEPAFAVVPTLVGLSRNTPGALRQAVAFALECWWTDDGDELVRLTRLPTLPMGSLKVRVLPSQVGHPEAEPLVRTLMLPWLSGLAGLALHPGDGTWAATLDDAGHHQLLTFLTLLERPQAQIPALIPAADQADLRLPLVAPPQGDTWPALAEDLLRRTGQGLAIRDPAHLPPPRLTGHPTTLGELPGAFAGVRAAWIHGVLCIQANTIPEDAAHPGSTRRFACLPIAHLLAEAPGITADALADAVRLRTGPARWARPGCALVAADSGRMLLAAGEIPLLHAVLDALGRIDGVGYPAWLAEASPR